jgi:hypothetical protein
MPGPVIERVFDAMRLNEIINHPSVHPWVCGMTQGYLDMTPAVQDKRNVLLQGEYGAIIFDCRQPGLYEAHSQCLPEGRGAWMARFTLMALHWMFTKTDCMEVLTRVPKGNLAARALTKASGLSYRFTNPHGWAFNGKVVSADVFGLTVQDWITSAPNLVEKGRAARAILARELRPVATIGIPDDGNDRQLGAAVDMIFGGQPEKGVVFFNRWTAMTDQPHISMLSRRPLAFDLQGVLLVFRSSGEIFAVRKAA